MTSFVRIWRSSDLRYLTFRRRFGTFEKSKDCDSRNTPERPETCRPSTNDDPCHDDPCPPCPPCPSPRQSPPCPPPELPIYHPPSDPRKLAFWRMLSLYIALPLVAIMSVVTYSRQREKAKQPREPFLNLPYMCRRTKPFPWGDGNHSLFHNPVKNPVPPHGYEVEDPNARREEKPKKAGN